MRQPSRSESSFLMSQLLGTCLLAAWPPDHDLHFMTQATRIHCARVKISFLPEVEVSAVEGGAR